MRKSSLILSNSHLGESRSTLLTRLLNWTSQFESPGGFLPMQSIPFAVFHSGVIPSPRFSRFGPSSTLGQHLRSILSGYVPGTQDPPPDPRSDFNAVETAASNKNRGGQPTTGFLSQRPRYPRLLLMWTCRARSIVGMGT